MSEHEPCGISTHSPDCLTNTTAHAFAELNDAVREMARAYQASAEKVGAKIAAAFRVSK